MRYRARFGLKLWIFGTRIYIDGYQVFSVCHESSATGRYRTQNAQSNTLHVYDVDIELNTLKSEEIL